MFAGQKKREEQKPGEEKKPDLFTERMLAHEEVIKQRPDAVGFFLGKKKEFGEAAMLFEEGGVEKQGRQSFEKSVKIELEAMKKGRKPARKKRQAAAKKRKEKDLPPKD